MDHGSFSIGYNWKYCDYDLGEYGENRGVDPQYRVTPQYNDLKEEMLNYRYFPFVQYKRVMTKAEGYFNTEIARSIKGPRRYPFGVEHLICIILYCDYSELSTDFTLSFRKSHDFQILSHIKKHNSCYFHWGLILREAIMSYGQSYNKENGILSELRGPFFCGMSKVLNIPHFNMYINCPLSTSIYCEVALKFSGEAGMILQLDNSRGDCQMLKGMDVSWISRFREEDERYIYVYIYHTSIQYLCL